MQFITSGNRIAVENFTLGDLYTITFTSGTYINSACIGIGENFVSFQRNEPELLFTLNMETAELVSSIDLYAGGTGTNNYNELTNKPQIGGVELVGNKSLSDLGIQAEITAESPLSSSLVSGLGSAAAADSSDFATAAQGALAASAIQSAGTGLTKSGTTLNHSNSVTAQASASFSSITFDAQGHITGSTAATTAQLNAINSGVTSTDVAQIETNKTNILSNKNSGFLQKNMLNIPDNTYTVTGLTVVASGGELTYTSTNATSHAIVIGTIDLPAGDYYLTDRAAGAKGYDLRLLVDSTNVTTTAENAPFTLATAKTVEIRAYSYATITNQKISPMIITAADYNAGLTSYTPYAPSNAELYKMILALQ